MAKWLYENYKSKPMYGEKLYKCFIVKNWLHFFLWPSYNFILDFDDLEASSKRRIYRCIKNNIDLIAWLKENTTGIAFVFIFRDQSGIGYDTFKKMFTTDVKVMRVFFTSKIDAMAFKLKWL